MRILIIIYGFFICILTGCPMSTNNSCSECRPFTGENVWLRELDDKPPLKFLLHDYIDRSTGLWERY